MGEGTRARGASLGSIAAALIGLFAFALMLSVPLIAVWAASSLAAYADGPRALSIAGGALLWPVLPAAWELWAERRRRAAIAKSKRAPRERILALRDRITLRTMVLSVAFLAPFVALQPALLFQALTTRGDWFLDGQQGGWVEPTRHATLAAADGLVWIYDASHDNPWREVDGAHTTSGRAHDDDDGTPMATAESITVDGESTSTATDTLPPTTTTTPAPSASASATPTASATASASATPTATAIAITTAPAHWPWSNAPHPLAVSAPPEATASVAALAQWFAGRINDPTERARAIHDWIALNVAYDTDAYFSGSYPPQGADHVLATRRSVCAGYATLFTAVSNAAGLRAETVVGDARGFGSEPEGHAWNAIELDGRWQLVDTTWDAGSVDDAHAFHRDVTARYFLAPPEIMGVAHFPDEARWQLRDVPLTRGEFNRQPNVRPEFFAAGMRLIDPDRAQIEAGPRVHARVDGPLFVLATAEPTQGGERISCDVSGSSTREVTCELPSSGAWRVWLFQSPVRYGTYGAGASFDVVYR